jgi:hypothetical protein
VSAFLSTRHLPHVVSTLVATHLRQCNISECLTPIHYFFTILQLGDNLGTVSGSKLLLGNSGGSLDGRSSDNGVVDLLVLVALDGLGDGLGDSSRRLGGLELNNVSGLGGLVGVLDHLGDDADLAGGLAVVHTDSLVVRETGLVVSGQVVESVGVSRQSGVDALSLNEVSVGALGALPDEIVRDVGHF